MVDVPRVEVVLVEEVAEGSVADVMEQPGDPHRLFHELRRGNVGQRDLQRRVKVLGPLARKVHCTERVLKARVLRGRKNPPRALELVDAAQPLQPRRVDQVLLGRLPGDSARAAFGDAKVAVDGIAG